MPDTLYNVVLNSRSGTAAALGLAGPDLERRFAEAGLSAQVNADEDTPLEDRIRRACEGDADIIVAAGGDGTVSALASALADTGRTMAILPLGTVNSLARDLGMPLEIDEWIAALPRVERRRIDLGEVNGQIFLHMVVIGLMPGIAALREQLRGSGSPFAALALARYFLRRLMRSRRFTVEIGTGDGPTRRARVQAVAVSNNTYAEEFGHFLARQRLDASKLGLYILKRISIVDAARLAGRMLTGRWRADAAIEADAVETVVVSGRKPRRKVMFDGEVKMLEAPMRFRIRPGALRIMAPRDNGARTAPDAPAAKG